jgi:CRP-like cAMP-binding protein
MSSRESNKRLKELAAALKAEPGSIPRRLELAAALRDAGRPADAIDLYRGVAEVYAEEGRLVQAMAVCKGILEMDPEHRDTLEMLATLAQKRASRKVGATEMRQVEGRWLAEPPGPQDEPLYGEPSGSGTRVGADPDATRIGAAEDVHDVRSALRSHTPPGGVPAYEAMDLSEEEAGAETTDVGSDTHPELVQRLDEDDFRATVISKGVDVLADTAPQKKTVRMSQLSDEELSARDGTDLAETHESLARTTSTEITAPAFGAAQAAAGGVPEPSLYGSESDPNTNTLILDAMSVPLPRPTLKVEPPPFPLLSDLPRAAFLELLAKLSVVRLDAGETVLREGELGDACYLIASGSVRVTKAGVEVAVLGPGSFFGEFAVLADQRRHASVTTIEPVEVLEIRRKLLDQLVAAHPGVARTLRKFYRERLISTLMATAPFFERLQPQERASIAERFRPRRFGRGARIIEERSPGGGLFLILVGEVEVVRGPAEAEVALGKLGEGSYFGEMSLLRGGTASATVRAVRMTEVVQLPPRDFYEVVSQHPVLWEQLRSEAERRELANHAIVAGEARKSEDGTIYLV